MRTGPKAQNDISSRLNSMVRGAIVFSPKEILTSKTVSIKTADQLHKLVSSSMQSVYEQHLISKQRDLFETLKDRELIYIDASKKGDMDLFSYMAKVYFNNCSEDTRKKYNDFKYSHNPELFDGKSDATDKHFDKKMESYKQYPDREAEGSDMAISFMPFSDLSFLMLVAEQQDLNIFLDNIDAVSAREMGVINSGIRSGLLISSDQRMGMFINNTRGTWNFLLDSDGYPPQDGHDMKVMYL